MRHKIMFLTLMVLALPALTSSCGTAATSSPTPPTAPVEAYPPPAQAVPEYPSPEQAVPAYNPYPGPSEGEAIFMDWVQADALIQKGDVAKVYHAQTMYVTLELKDGSLVHTIESALGEVIKAIERCGEDCGDIELIEQ